MVLHRTFALTISRCYSSAILIHTPHHLYHHHHHYLRLLHILQLCVDHHSLKLVHQSHAQILVHGFSQNAFLTTRLVSAYATFGNSSLSRRVFESVEHKNVYLWNSMINGYAKNRDFDESLSLFRWMVRTVLPDDYTLASVSKVCGEVQDLVCGKMVHGKSVRIGSLSDIIVANSLMAMYCRCGVFEDAMQVFDEMPHKNVGSFNVIISGHTALGYCSFDYGDGFLWKFIARMQSEGLQPDVFTVASLLPVCCSGDTGKLDYGRELHCYLVKNGLDLKMGSDAHVGSSLVDMYSRSNKVVLSRRVFDQMKIRNVYVWTAMINGYVANGAPECALVLFREMQTKDGIRPNKVSLISMLPACVSLAGLMGGKQAHTFAIRMELDDDLSLCNSLIDMYSKCGSLDYARKIFDNGLYFKDGISWSSMISAYGLHGRGKEAIITYYKMLKQGIKPDMITVVGVLSACGKSGLVDEGISIYNTLITKYEMKPTVEVCACVVDMLGRSGWLDQALQFMKAMPLDPGPSVWGSLLSASIMHGNLMMRDLAYRCLLELEPENPSNYISFSNIYAFDKQWDMVIEARTMMKERGLRKVPGCSWITISGKTHSFTVADKVHPSSSLIYGMLDDLLPIMTTYVCAEMDILS